MEGRRRYRNPPIEEALCELYFDPSEEWELTIPGKLHTALRNEYSGKPRHQNVVQVGLTVQDGKPAAFQHEEGLRRVLLVTEDGTRMVGIGPDVVSVHMLRPYQGTASPTEGGWEEFRERIQQTLDAYWKVTEPNGVKRIGIRYVNRIDIPQESVNVEDYLKCTLPVVPGLPEQVSQHVSRTEFVYDNGARLILSQANLPSSNSTQILLDIDIIWRTGTAIEKNKIVEMVQYLRDQERSAFEAIITDKARELFDAE